MCDTTKCPTCGINDVQEPHTCPYKYEIDDDGSTLCTCCSSCEGDCKDDV